MWWPFQIKTHRTWLISQGLLLSSLPLSFHISLHFSVLSQCLAPFIYLFSLLCMFLIHCSTVPRPCYEDTIEPARPTKVTGIYSPLCASEVNLSQWASLIDTKRAHTHKLTWPIWKILLVRNQSSQRADIVLASLNGVLYCTVLCAFQSDDIVSVTAL